MYLRVWLPAKQEARTLTRKVSSFLWNACARLTSLCFSRSPNFFLACLDMKMKKYLYIFERERNYYLRLSSLLMSIPTLTSFLRDDMLDKTKQATPTCSVSHHSSSTHMHCFVESKTEHVCSLPWWVYVRLNGENRVLWVRFPWTKIESIRLVFHVQKPSSLDLIFMYRNRVQWTRFPCLCGHLNSPKSSHWLELLETKLVSNVV